jgi:hypothetical protein
VERAEREGPRRRPADSLEDAGLPDNADLAGEGHDDSTMLSAPRKGHRAGRNRPLKSSGPQGSDNNMTAVTGSPRGSSGSGPGGTGGWRRGPRSAGGHFDPSHLTIDPQSGLFIDPETGLAVDPTDGHVLDPAAAAAMSAQIKAGLPYHAGAAGTGGGDTGGTAEAGAGTGEPKSGRGDGGDDDEEEGGGHRSGDESEDEELEEFKFVRKTLPKSAISHEEQRMEFRCLDYSPVRLGGGGRGGGGLHAHADAQARSSTSFPSAAGATAAGERAAGGPDGAAAPGEGAAQDPRVHRPDLLQRGRRRAAPHAGRHRLQPAAAGQGGHPRV